MCALMKPSVVVTNLNPGMDCEHELSLSVVVTHLNPGMDCNIRFGGSPPGWSAYLCLFDSGQVNIVAQECRMWVTCRSTALHRDSHHRWCLQMYLSPWVECLSRRFRWHTAKPPHAQCSAPTSTVSVPLANHTNAKLGHTMSVYICDCPDAWALCASLHNALLIWLAHLYGNVLSPTHSATKQELNYQGQATKSSPPANVHTVTNTLIQTTPLQI